MTKSFFKLLALLAPLALITGPALAAGPHEAPIAEYAKTKAPAWLNNAVVINAVKAQNAKNAALTQADIDKMDKQWMAETKASGKPLIDAVLGNELSKYLKKVQEDSKGLITEIFVMDDKGLNVGQSEVTSDYWQGDEAKWQKTFKVGPDAIHIGDVSQDESTQRFQSQLSLPVVDPEAKKVIGAVTIGLDVENLQ
jgi:hypothetical protein